MANPIAMVEGPFGEALAAGHAFEKHISEFENLGIRTRSGLASLADQIVRDAKGENVRELSGGRTAYWDARTGTVVIRDPNSADAGTIFRPKNGRDYFENLK